MEKENDVQLVNATLLGNDAAFNVLVEKYQEGIHALAWRKVGDFHYAEEITQDTFLQAYKKLSTLRNPNQFAGWLYVIANRLCIAWLRKQKPVMQSLDSMSVKAINELSYKRYVSDDLDTQATERRYEIVERLLEKLPESERTVVTLHYLGEMTAKEISKFLGVSANTIGSRLQRARNRLRSEEKTLISEILGGFQFPANLTKNIMRYVADMKLTPPPTTKPMLPWMSLGTAVVLIGVLLGASNQYLLHFQQPYSFEAQSEHTIEIIDAPIVLDIDSKPDIRNQIGSEAPSSHNGNVGSQTSETLLASTTGENSGMHERNIELCTQNLMAIGKAIQTYQKEHEDFPEWLSDLHPKYLTDVHLFICPADEEDGKAVFQPSVDPRMPVSYGYQLCPEYRDKKSEQHLVFGNVIPLVRCLHHMNEDFDALNLSFSSQIYRSSTIWEHTPEDMYGSHEAALTAIEEILARHPDDKRYPDDKRFFDLYPQLVRLHTIVGNEQSAAAIIERLKSGMIRDLQGYQILFDIFKKVERYEDLLPFFQEAEQQYPDKEFIFWKLTDIHRKLGNTELAEAYERKFDLIYELFGKPVPDFSVISLDGHPISLQDYRGKVVLLHFWEVGSDSCIAEMPEVKKVYDTYKDAGFDIIGVSLDHEEAILRSYVKINGIQWRQVFDTAAYSLLRQYDIVGVPEMWLIDRESKLITHKTTGEHLEKLVAEAVRDCSPDEARK